MVMQEAEIFEVKLDNVNYGMYMVNSVHPYELDFEKELNSVYNGVDGDVHEHCKTVLDNLLASNRIVKWEAEYIIELGIFDEYPHITRVQKWSNVTLGGVNGIIMMSLSAQGRSASLKKRI